MIRMKVKDLVLEIRYYTGTLGIVKYGRIDCILMVGSKQKPGSTCCSYRHNRRHPRSEPFILFCPDLSGHTPIPSVT